MEEIRVSEVSYSVYDYPMMEYACDECGARFIDHDESYQYCPHCGKKIRWIVEDSRLHLGDGETRMDNKPICGEWHGNDVMPSENKLCIFEIKVGEASKGEILIGYRQCDIIARESCDCEFACFEDAVIRWCYIDLN